VAVLFLEKSNGSEFNKNKKSRKIKDLRDLFNKTDKTWG